MERARPRKTKSASGIEGIKQIHKKKPVPRLSSDSHSYIDGSDIDDMFMVEMCHNTIGRVTGAPMKKLLAEEMSKDVEYKTRSPSIIARLMGFDGLPSPRNVHRQRKKFPENYHQKHVLINDQRNNQLYGGKSNRISSLDQQEFKDVYEDLEAAHVMNRRCSSRWSANSILTKPEMELIRQKFIDVKPLCTEERLQGSKELDDTLEKLDSNKELRLKLFGQSNSLFMKHLRDQQVDPGSSLGCHIAVLKPSDSEKFKSKAKAWRSEKVDSNKPHVTSHLKHEDGLLLERHSRRRSCISRSSLKVQVEEATDENILPTRIVVLKPNLGRLQNTDTSYFSPDHSQGYLPSFKKIQEYRSVGCAESGSRRRKEASHKTGLSTAMSKEARQIAREITMRMRDGCNESTDAKSIAYRGYVGDESSYDANESDSDSEPDVLGLSSRYPPSQFAESAANMIVRKRPSERWKMAHKYKDIEKSSRGSTLGEMLACPDKGTSSHQLNATMSQSRARKGLGSNNGSAILDFPLGISSKDGWMDEICRNFSRSRSHPPPSGVEGRSYKRSPNPDRWSEDKDLMHSGFVYCGESKVKKGNLSHREYYSAKESKSRSKAVHPCRHLSANDINSSSEANIEIPMEPSTKHLSERQSMFPMAEKANNSELSIVDVTIISGPGSTTVSSKSCEMLLDQPQSTVASDKVANHKLEDGCIQEFLKESPKQGCHHLQCLGAELESCESSKEADHPSPVSVLEVPCSEDTSSSECFDRVHAELHELRMQLKLLKLESGACSETSILHPIKEDAQLSPNVCEGNHVLAADCRRSMYVLDVFINSGVEESQFNMTRPLDPKLFEKLEKKYNDEGQRWERKLLFDRTNSALLEMFQEHENTSPWVMPKLAGLRLQWKGVQEAVNNRLMEEEHAGGERELDREMLWSDYRGEMDILANEIEKLLIDDMITEVICN